MSLNTVTLTWNIQDMLQSAVSKAVLSVTPSAQVNYVSGGIVVARVARTVTFTGGTGSISGIVATDNTGILPSPFQYLISVINAVDTRQVLVPQFPTPLAFANGATQDLSVLLAAYL